MKIALTLAAALGALSLAACDSKPEPQGEATGAAMPDTSQAEATTMQAAPDAGVTGVVPADGSPAPVQPAPAPQ